MTTGTKSHSALRIVDLPWSAPRSQEIAKGMSQEAKSKYTSGITCGYSEKNGVHVTHVTDEVGRYCDTTVPNPAKGPFPTRRYYRIRTTSESP